jgi:gamma-glutamyltranspeptidase/glutathione hydrolase
MRYVVAFRILFVQASVRGGLAIAVPGEPAGYFTAFSKFGSGNLQWKDLFQGPINLARNGFKVDAMMAIRISQSKDMIKSNPGLAKMFMNNDKFKVEGDTITRLEYANMLERLANEVSTFPLD